MTEGDYARNIAQRLIDIHGIKDACHEAMKMKYFFYARGNFKSAENWEEIVEFIKSGMDKDSSKEIIHKQESSDYKTVITDLKEKIEAVNMDASTKNA